LHIKYALYFIKDLDIIGLALFIRIGNLFVPFFKLSISAKNLWPDLKIILRCNNATYCINSYYFGVYIYSLAYWKKRTEIYFLKFYLLQEIELQAKSLKPDFREFSFFSLFFFPFNLVPLLSYNKTHRMFMFLLS
jgi:hypothetical protein